MAEALENFSSDGVATDEVAENFSTDEAAMKFSSDGVATDETAESFSPDVVATDEDKFGFQREEMYQVKLAGTVDPYDRHLFLCYKSPGDWPPRVEDSDADPLPKLLSEAIKDRKNDINVKTRLTICEGRDGTGLSDGDILIFPEMIKYNGLKESDVNGFVEDVLVNEKPWTSGVQEELSGSHIFVCAHNSRDRRCGVCGPPLIEKFKEEIESRSLNDQVFVSACSHVGGHKYAGNLIIFSPTTAGKICGHWYGYVAPTDVPELLDQHIGKGEIIERLWRGQMGASAVENETEGVIKLPNGENLLKSEKESEKENVLKLLPNGESIQTSVKEIVESCCQGASGFSCCRNGNSDSKEEATEVKQVRGIGGKVSSWMANVEQADVLAGVAVVGAVATVAVACSLYKRRSG